MATYEYVCRTCGKSFDYVQSMKDDAFTTCPVDVCEQESPGEGEVHRVISGGGGVIYKGEGFYLTDYVHNKDATRKPAPSSASTTTPSADAAPSPSGAAATGASSSTDSKPSSTP